MTREDIILLAREAGLPYMYETGEVANIELVERFAELVAAHKEKEMQERIDALFALYEQACQQRDQLMDMQRAQVEAMRGRTQ